VIFEASTASANEPVTVVALEGWTGGVVGVATGAAGVAGVVVGAVGAALGGVVVSSCSVVALPSTFALLDFVASVV
jgi:hypothetical protein